MISKRRIEEATAMFNLYGDMAAEKMGVSLESLHRYLRGTNEKEEKTLPNVVLFDIETAPAETWSFQFWKTNIQPDFIKKPWHMLGWSAKTLFDSTILSDIVTPEEAIARDDKRISESLWNVINSADIVIGHNARKFDIPHANTRFLIHGLPPPAPYRILDTLDVLHKNFAFEHNRLDYVNRILGLKRKLETDHGLWQECMAGDQTALSQMQEYNKNDVGILEELYVAIRGWVKSHPNMNLYMEGDGRSCANCGCEKLEYVGSYYADTRKFASYRCKECGAIMRATKMTGRANVRSVAR